ncbi:MAG TPA: CHAD domain-containing protein [Solirubrobacteraceae bacterium]|nr:CHAD domain-containing protein [Solirubrobacteraceae bacterium]
MAPVAATLAASLAVGVGLVLARSERARRRTPAREHDHELGLHPGEPLPTGLRRMALGQVDLALEQLGAAGGNGRAPDETAVHETRKAIKRLRALLRVLRHELGERGFQRENAALRDVARELSATRDATVMLATLDALIARNPRKLGRRRGVRALRERVAGESARMQQLTLADALARANVLGELHAIRWRVAAWPLPAQDGLGLIDADLEALYRQGRARGRRARRAHGERALAMHMWRKRVKDLRYVAEMLERRQPASAANARATGKRTGAKRTGSKPAGSKSADSKRAGAHAARLRKLAARADALGELLGEEHDLAVLEAHLRSCAKRKRRHKATRAEERDALWRTGRATRKALLRAIAKRRRQLHRRALRKGERLYREQPRRFMRGVRAGYQRGTSQPNVS